jgi:hypothetical protein
MRKPARNQTKVSAVRSCGSWTDANLGNARLLSTGNASGMPEQTQAAHLLLFGGPALSDPVPVGWSKDLSGWGRDSRW